jgi:RNA-binding protein NOB1
MSSGEEVYRALVVDSGPIIRRTALTSLWRRAETFYTVPAVLQEIRDAKAREHLENLPFTLVIREPSHEGIKAMVEFSRQTGDHLSLSAVDLQVLGLLYDLEREGTDMEHVRTTPKRPVGVGTIKMMGGGEKKSPATASNEQYDVVEDEEEEEEEEEDSESDQEADAPPVDDFNEEKAHETAASSNQPPQPKTWAMLVNPTEASTALPIVPEPASIAEKAVHVSFGKMNLRKEHVESEDVGGQFSDAEEDTLGEEEEESSSEFNSQKEISDEECDVYIRDPDDLEGEKSLTVDQQRALEEDLKSELPSLAAARLVPYEGSDDEGDEEEAKRRADEERKRQSLQPISNSGKLYNSFRKYGDLLKTKPVKKNTPVAPIEDKKAETGDIKEDQELTKNQSRIIGGMAMAGQDIDVEDDGEGWITCSKDINAMKAVGALDPKQNPQKLNGGGRLGGLHAGPPASQRAACATTDFAMQNVILQMNLELLSVDGVKVRKVKSWVTRCAACFKVYTSSDNVGPLGTKRLFCERCGSDVMQRIAASVDGKTGRLRLHLKKNYKHNLRGTKFSLPKPGTGNRFQGDLLLREDQLMTGAWNQKVKMMSGGKAKNGAQSIFGSDIATNVGCHANATGSDAIRVGFGRRNPNAAKGRERRGKKKKSTEKACGLRRY